jgi:hypothetical protein
VIATANAMIASAYDWSYIGGPANRRRSCTSTVEPRRTMRGDTAGSDSSREGGFSLTKRQPETAPRRARMPQAPRTTHPRTLTPPLSRQYGMTGSLS